MATFSARFYKPEAAADLVHRTQTAASTTSADVTLPYALIPNAAKQTFPAVAVSAGFGTIEIDIEYQSPVNLNVLYLAGVSINTGLTFTLFNIDASPVVVASRVQDADSAIRNTANELMLLDATATRWQLQVSGIPIESGDRIHFDIDSIFLGSLGFAATDDNYDWGFSEVDLENADVRKNRVQSFGSEDYEPRVFASSYSTLSDADNIAFRRFHKGLNRSFCLLDTKPLDSNPETKVLGWLNGGRRRATQQNINQRQVSLTEKRQWL